jgi:hypothetical protein
VHYTSDTDSMPNDTAAVAHTVDVLVNNIFDTSSALQCTGVESVKGPELEKQ